MNYGSGIYTYQTGERIGKHAVKLLGYGEENGIKFYTCENQWGANWGEKGYFRVAIGQVNID